MLLFELVKLIFGYLPVDSKMCFRITNKTYLSLQTEYVDSSDIVYSVTKHNNIHYYRYIIDLANLDIDTYHATAAVCNGSLDLLIYITSKIEPIKEDILYWSVQYGHLAILQWIIKKYGKIWDDTTATTAARYGNIDILEWLLENGCVYSGAVKGMFNETYVKADIVDKTVKWLLDRELIPTENMACMITKQGNFELIQRIDKSMWATCFNGAVAGDNINILEWFKNNGCVSIEYKVGCEKLETLDWLHNNSYIPNTKFLLEVINNNRLIILKWLWEKGYNISDETIDYIKRNGSPEMLRWLIMEFRCDKLTNKMFENMSGFGDIEMLELLKSKKCPMDYKSYIGALLNDNICVMNWLKENGCALNKKIWIYASVEKSKCLKWLKDNKCPWDSDICETISNDDDFEYLKWLISNGCPLSGNECYSAAVSNRIDVLKWLRSKNCVWDESVCAVAAELGHLKLLKWLRKNNCPWDKSTFLGAYKAKQLSCAGWAVKHGCPID
jgi:hypothetical protein